MAVWGMGVMLGPIIGPSLGGYLTEYYSWRWVFFINLPLGIISFIGLMVFLPESQRIERPFDKLGFLTLSIVIACLQLIMDRGEQVDWLESLEIQVYVGVIIGAAWMYVVHTLSTPHPFLSPGMLRDRNLQLGLFFMFAVGIILLATMALLPPFMQNLMGYSVMDVGITLAPRGFGTLMAMMVVSKISSHVDARWLVMFGLGLTAIALHMMTGFSVFVPKQDIVVSGLVQGFGLGFVFIPLSTLPRRSREFVQPDSQHGQQHRRVGGLHVILAQHACAACLSHRIRHAVFHMVEPRRRPGCPLARQQCRARADRW
jgi:DHA2 family multidrug resistance protein